MIDLSLTAIWKAWANFRRGKKPSRAIRTFEAELESQLLRLCADLNSGHYRHGPYDHKIVNEKKRRDIAVAGVRDRVVHRLLYDCLVPLADSRLDYDVWSCRRGKGLHAGLVRTRQLASRYRDAWVWRADIEKFFDHVNHDVLKVCLNRLTADATLLGLLTRVVDSYSCTPRTGIPIGNLTSQVFANIYLQEFDRFVRHLIKPLAYVRYGDDFVLFVPGPDDAVRARAAAREWLQIHLRLRLHAKNDWILPARRGLHFLGHRIYPLAPVTISKDLRAKVERSLDRHNAGSYQAMYLSRQQRRRVPWILLDSGSQTLYPSADGSQDR